MLRKCPNCGKFSVEENLYFDRFRCLNPECLWTESKKTSEIVRYSLETLENISATLEEIRKKIIALKKPAEIVIYEKPYNL